MRASPLRLEESSLEKVEFLASPDFSPDDLNSADLPSLYQEWKLGCEITRLERKGKEGPPYGIRMRVHMGEGLSEGAKAPFKFSIEMIGIFSILESVPEANRIRLLEVNGPAVLYGSIREILHTLTARSHLPPLLLPTVTFAPAPEESAESE